MTHDTTLVFVFFGSYLRPRVPSWLGSCSRFCSGEKASVTFSLPTSVQIRVNFFRGRTLGAILTGILATIEREVGVITERVFEKLILPLRSTGLICAITGAMSTMLSTTPLQPEEDRPDKSCAFASKPHSG